MRAQVVHANNDQPSQRPEMNCPNEWSQARVLRLARSHGEQVTNAFYGGWPGLFARCVWKQHACAWSYATLPYGQQPNIAHAEMVPAGLAMLMHGMSKLAQEKKPESLRHVDYLIIWGDNFWVPRSHEFFDQWQLSPISPPMITYWFREDVPATTGLPFDFLWPSNGGIVRNGEKLCGHNSTPWEGRIPQLYFRMGGWNGNPHRLAVLTWAARRVNETLCSHGSGSEVPCALNIKLVGSKKQCLDLHHDLRDRWHSNSELCSYMVQQHPDPPSRIASYKYTIDLDGYGTAMRLKYVMHTGALLFRPVPPVIDSYFGSLLRPWVHFVPISNDPGQILADLEEKLRWALENDSASKSIASRGFQLARQMYSGQAVATHSAHTISCYARHFSGMDLLSRAGLPVSALQPITCANLSKACCEGYPGGRVGGLLGDGYSKFCEGKWVDAITCV